MSQQNKKTMSKEIIEDTLINILKDQVKPALGCTEPSAVGLAIARAKELLGETVGQLDITVDKNMLKNGLNVGIPGTNERGLVFAAALALVVGKSEYGLEVFKEVKDADVVKAMAIVNDKIVSIKLAEEAEGLYIHVEATSDNHVAEVIIENSHTNIVYEGLDDKPSRIQAQSQSIEQSSEPIKNVIKVFSIKELINFCDTVDIAKINFILDGIELNERVARYGISEDLGIGLGRFYFKKALDPKSLGKAMTVAASEARMTGCHLPVMSSAGSGNHGLVAVLPVAVIGKEKGINSDKICRAVTLCHLITIFVKVYLGVLSPICGCGVAAGVGSAAGLVYLEEGNHQQIKAAIKNMVAGLTGMICDGAKLGCASKLAIAVDSAYDAAELALENINIPSDNGILAETAEQTIKNLALISTVGMKDTDNIILDVMLRGC
jgi:L-cysteine desulfidase